MARILITGASSFIGRALAVHRAACGDLVHLLIRPSSDYGQLPDGIDTIRLHEVDGTAEQLIDVVARIKPDVTIHLAGHYLREPGSSEVDALVSNNIQFGIQVLESLRRTDSGRIFINTGTYAQFAADGSREPLNLYAAAKQAFESVLEYYVKAEAFQALTLILHDTYGPGDQREKFLNAVKQAQSNGSVLSLPDEDVAMDLVHIDDVIAAFEQAIELLVGAHNLVNAGTFFVSLDRLHKISEIITLFIKIGRCNVSVEWGGYPLPRRRISAPYRGPMLPGWQAKISLEDGIRELLAVGNPDED